MCFDPISMGLMAAGTALSGYGTIKQSRANQNSLNTVQAAENNVLNRTLDKEAGFQNQNAGNIRDIVAKFSPGAQSADLAAAEGNRDAAIGSAIAQPTTPVANGDYTPQIVKDVAAKKLFDGFQYATNLAKAQAKAGSYGDVAGANARAISDASGNIDMVNNFAKGTGAILPDQQQLAGAAVYTPPSQLGSLMTSLGGLAAGAGASGAAAKGISSLGAMPATGVGAPGPFMSNLYAASQGINPFGQS